ncbi:hypothetical protein [Bradyrhizobium sp. DASA03007]|uniref:hypothetical protein n=1 Tax=unclassified Bradyrhizobium TaxID=2631580 RepID=UPI003F6F0BCC
MSNIESKSISNRTILIALLIFNMVGIGLSEIQRRQLGNQSTEAVLELQAIERKRIADAAADWERTYKLLAQINQRVNNVEIALQSGPLAGEVRDIYERLKAVQTKVEATTVAK